MPDLLAEVVQAARREQARSVGDALLRRTRLGLLAARELTAPDSDAPRRVAAALGRELGWDAVRIESELARFQDEAAAEGIVAAR
jgi:glycerol-3-phosphate dehydrogenase